MPREGTSSPGISAGHQADVYRWSYLEKNVDNVMWKLEEGLDMKTVSMTNIHHVSLVD